MSRRLRIGVAGVGRIGSLHARNVASSAGTAELVAVADPVRKLARSVAMKFGARMYKDPGQMLKRENLDGVIIATPTPLHTNHVVLASEARVPMLLEKPIALTLGEAEKITSTIRRSRVKFMLGFNRRFDQSFRRAKQAVVTGKIGKPFLVKTCARDPSPPPEEYIRHSGGIFVDECIHDIDIALWLMNDKVVEVMAMGTTLAYPQFSKYHDYDNAVAVLKFRSHALGIIEGSRTSRYGYDLRTEILGSKGVVKVDNWKNNASRVSTKRGTLDEPYPWFTERFADAYRREIETFCDYISKDMKSPVSAEDGRDALRVAIAAREAAAKKRPVSLQ